MAKQKGVIKLKGTVDDITFYKSQDGHLARAKGGVDAKRIATDPNFQRTRENGAEFGAGGKAGKLLRSSLRILMQNAADNRVVSRITQQMIRILKTDPTSPRGQRKVSLGNLLLLKDFDFNQNGTLKTTVFVEDISTINRVAGTLSVHLEKFVPQDLIVAPQGATHFKLISAGVEVDFDNKKFVADTQSSDVIAWDTNPAGPIDLVNTVTANSGLPLLLAFGVEFFQEVNGQMYPLKNGGFNALALTEISKV